MTAVYVVLGLVGLVVLWGIAIYNRLIRRRNLVEEGWSGIDVQLKRRANLIPNLIETVKGYAEFERGVLDEVTRLRTRSMGTAQRGEKGDVEQALGRALANLFAVAEAYPELQANKSFLDLQNELSEIEDQIQLARRYYNGATRDLNILIESFPSNLVARAFSFIKAEFFELDDAGARAVPKVEF